MKGELQQVKKRSYNPDHELANSPSKTAGKIFTLKIQVRENIGADSMIFSNSVEEEDRLTNPGA